MTLVQLQYLIALDTHQHFGLAAEHCFVTQPTLSMQIQKLEKELGAILFDRGKQPVVPTEVGRRVIEQARIILREAARVGDILQDASGEISGVFKIGIIPTVAPYLLPLFLQNFVKKYPGISLQIEELQTHQIIDRIRHDRLDAGILATPLHNPSITEEPLFYEPFVAYVSRNHSLYDRKKIKAEDLDLADVWLLNEGHCFRDQVVQLCKKSLKNNEGSDRAVTFESGNLETLKKLVEQNFGLTLLPYLAARELEETKEGDMLRKFLKPVPKREISIVYERSRLKKQVIDALLKEIKAALPKKLLKDDDALLV
ncbi:MAG TPA: LysR substrate-binding domain-containing protein [Patescibacteria group bacterium]|nr:LysR substrate-binding domain-containing protein [Patescibacteria group bacterium]